MSLHDVSFFSILLSWTSFQMVTVFEDFHNIMKMLTYPSTLSKVLGWKQLRNCFERFYKFQTTGNRHVQSMDFFCVEPANVTIPIYLAFGLIFF